MNLSVIPLEAWLGSFKENNADSEFKYKFLASGCFNVENVETGLKPFLHTAKDPLVYIHGTELLLGVNAMFNTDISMMPEGIKGDFSNIIYCKDEEDGEYKYLVFIDGDDIEGGFSIEVDDEKQGKISIKDFAFTLTPEFDSFLDNDSDTFMTLITNTEAGNKLNENLAVIGKVKEDAPSFRLMKIDLDRFPEMHRYDTATEIGNITKVGISRYINKCMPKIIHDDMVEKIKHLAFMETPEGKNEIAISIELFGFLYFISVEYLTDYDFGEVVEDLAEE